MHRGVGRLCQTPSKRNGHGVSQKRPTNDSYIRFLEARDSETRALSGHGSPVPDFNFTLETSVPLIDPLTVTSLRKFEPVTACPDCNLV